MGLCLTVGVLVGLEEDEDARPWKGHFDAVNRLLRAAGLPEHREPFGLRDEDTVSLDMYGYSGLHYLRRIAAHLWAGHGPPPPGDENAHRDPIMQRYYDTMGGDPGGGGGFLARFRTAPGRRPRFDHLLFHSDAEGFYLPLPFEKVLFADEDRDVPGGMVGSSYKLRDECRALAEALALPLDLDPESDELWTAADSQGQGQGWRRYGVESFTCLRLHYAAERSIAGKAALVFT